MFDAGIAGGGLAGLALAIQCSRAGHSVVLMEKENYPFHRVCGEYISNESRAFLQSLGVPVNDLSLPEMQTLLLTDTSGFKISHPLPLGGFGISRYELDAKLYELAKDSGVTIMTGGKVEEIIFDNDSFTFKSRSGDVQARVAVGCFGKRSNIDVKWNRHFIGQKKNSLNNLIGVKYHVTANWKKDEIALHHFQNGYCGISAVENNKFCVCYLTTAQNLQQSGSIQNLEEQVLKENPSLKNALSESTKIAGPFTISQVSFAGKSRVENHVLLVGDAAGMITPLCGNGMSMALHGSKIAFACIHDFLEGKTSRVQMENAYERKWKMQFAARIKTGRIVQRFFSGKRTAHLILSVLKPFPKLITRIVKQTHGEPF